MRLIVHAGPGKTGTTAIQKSLLKAAETLREQGVLYLGLMLERGPVKLYNWQRPGGFDDFHRLPKERARQELETLLRETMAAAAEAGAHTLVISNESLLRREATFIEVLEKLRSDGASLLIVAYARRYDELARSAYVQWGLNHKTYAGPLKTFQQWMQGRELALSPSVLRWQSRLGSDFHLRNFDTCGNVVVDFLEVAGLAGSGVESLRSYETPTPNEIALRALFNEQHAGMVSSSRFTKLFESNRLSFDRPLGEWLRTLMPSAEALVELDAAFATERCSINQLLAAANQPLLDDGVAISGPMQLDTEAMLGTLFQLIAKQALKIEALEQAMATLVQPAQAGQPQPARSAISAAPVSGVPVDPAISDALAPALGYFGATANDNLQLALPGMVKEIRLSIHEKKPTFLNLRGLELRYRGKPVVADARRGVATQSSTSGNDQRNGPDGLLAQTGVHSAAENAPWWRIEFDTPVACDELRLWNRSDGWGSRSRTLMIDIVDHEGQTLRVHDAQSSSSLAKVLEVASTAAGIQPATAFPTTTTAASALRSQLLATIAERIRVRAIGLASVDWRGIVPMLDVWRSNEPGADEWTLIAAFLLSQQQAKGGTSIKSFSLLLDSQVRLQRLQDELNELGRMLELGGFMLTRHGVKPEGVLRREPERFLGHMEAVLASLDRMGRQPVLAYGTLLGAVREGHFIAHDDDIDLLYRSQAHSRAEVEADLLVIKEAFRSDGFKVVDLLPNSLNMHVIDPRNGAVMDVFPCWEEQGRLQMHMESMKIRGIDPAIVYPTARLSFLGRELPAPAQAQAYLAERYGPGWQVSDQFFEWPWSLKSPGNG